MYILFALPKLQTSLFNTTIILFNIEDRGENQNINKLQNINLTIIISFIFELR